MWNVMTLYHGNYQEHKYFDTIQQATEWVCANAEQHKQYSICWISKEQIQAGEEQIKTDQI